MFEYRIVFNDGTVTNWVSIHQLNAMVESGVKGTKIEKRMK